jgi:DNA-binding MarR family transcriptional regulator
MKKADKQRLNDALDKALAPPRVRRNLDALLEAYDDSASPASEARLVKQTSLVSVNSLSTETSLVTDQPPAYSQTSLSSETSLVTENSQPPNLAEMAENLSYSAGHSRLNHDFFDEVLVRLNDKEQLLYIHLFRYREGSSNTTVLVSLPRLAERTSLSISSIQRAERSLIGKGMLEKLGTQNGYGKSQGRRYRLFIPTSLLTQTRLVKGNSLVPQTNIKEKLLKENNKKENELSPDFKNCPNCQGSGFYYPEGVEKGVAKCKHETLVKEGKL